MRLLERLFSARLLTLPATGVAVDVGFGDSSVTCLDWRTALRVQEPQRQVVGVEVDEGRVRAAQIETSELEFRQGGFALSDLALGDVAAVRCMNVLRGYGPENIKRAQEQMIAALMPGGLLIEGTTDTEGHLLTAHLWRRHPNHLAYEGLILATDCERGFAPLMFRDVLPRDLRRHVVPGEPIFDFLSEWTRQVEHLRNHGAQQDNAALFSASARALQTGGSSLCCSDEWVTAGAMIWTPEQPSKRPEVLAPRTMPVRPPPD